MEDKIVERIRKLLALSQSANEHEAAAAAARAAELMAAHQLHAATLTQAAPDPIGAHEIDRGGHAVSWRGILANGIAQSFGCRMYWKQGRQDGARYARTMVVGRAGDVDGVRYMYLYLSSEIERLAADAWTALPDRDRMCARPRSWKNAFRLGAATTIAGRLREARVQALQAARARATATGDDQAAHALVRVERDAAELEQFMARLGVRRKAAPTISAPGALGAGIAAARDVDLGTDHRRLARPMRRLTHGSR